jgi:hypothetical protein
MLTDSIRSFLRRVDHSAHDDEASTSNLPTRLLDVFLRTADLGFTSFGGPNVHFQIFHRRFVDGLGKRPWIDEQTVITVILIAFEEAYLWFLVPRDICSRTSPTRSRVY